MEKISATIEKEQLEFLEDQVREERFGSISHGIRFALKELMKKVKALPLRCFIEGKPMTLADTFIDNQRQVLGLCDVSALFNVVVPAGWTIKRYHGIFPTDEKPLAEMLKTPYTTEVLTEDRTFD